MLLRAVRTDDHGVIQLRTEGGANLGDVLGAQRRLFVQLRAAQRLGLCLACQCVDAVQLVLFPAVTP